MKKPNSPVRALRRSFMAKLDDHPLISLFGLGALLRLGHLALYRQDFWLRTALLDDSLFNTYAGVIRQEGWLARSLGSFDLNPGYPYLLAIMHTLGLGNVEKAFTFQHLVGAVVPVLLFLIAQELFDRRVAWLSGLIGMLYGPSYFYESRYLGELWIYLCHAGALFCLLRAYRASQPRGYWISAGFLLGISAVFRPTILAYVPIVLLWGSWHLRDRWRAGLLTLGLFVLSVWAPMIPFQIRNYVVNPASGFGLTTASGGVNLYLGNNPEADGLNRAPAFVRYGPAHEYLDFKEEAERRVGRSLTAKEVSRYWVRQTWLWMCREPASAWRLTWLKMAYFWNHREPPDNFFMSMFERFTRLGPVPLAGWGWIAPLGLVGMIWGFTRRRDPGFVLLALYVGFYFAINVSFYILSRYRFPVAAGMIPLAAWGGISLFDQFRKGAFGSMIALGILMAGSLWVSRLPIIGEEVPEVAHYNMGVIMANQGQKDLAIEEYRLSIKSNPQFKASYQNLGILLAERGKIADAIAALEGAYALESDPPKRQAIARALNNLRSAGTPQTSRPRS